VRGFLAPEIGSSSTRLEDIHRELNKASYLRISEMQWIWLAAEIVV
jgi:hypothetical protein